VYDAEVVQPSTHSFGTIRSLRIRAIEVDSRFVDDIIASVADDGSPEVELTAIGPRFVPDARSLDSYRSISDEAAFLCNVPFALPNDEPSTWWDVVECSLPVGVGTLPRWIVIDGRIVLGKRW
jgi:hypothetical protein